MLLQRAPHEVGLKRGEVRLKLRATSGRRLHCGLKESADDLGSRDGSSARLRKQSRQHADRFLPHEAVGIAETMFSELGETIKLAQASRLCSSGAQRFLAHGAMRCGGRFFQLEQFDLAQTFQRPERTDA